MYKKRSYKRTGYYRPTSSRAMARLPAYQSRASPTELKSVDWEQSAVGTPTDPFINLVNGLVQGTAFYERLGSQTRMWSMMFKWNIAPSSAAKGQKNCTFRIMIVYDRQSNNAMPNISDIITNYNSSGATSTDLLASGINPTNRDRFLILYDRKVKTGTVALSPSTAGYSYPDSALHAERYIKLAGLLTQFSGPTNGMGDVRMGALFAIVLGDDGAPSLNEWFVHLDCRLRYTDG